MFRLNDNQNVELNNNSEDSIPFIKVEEVVALIDQDNVGIVLKLFNCALNDWCSTTIKRTDLNKTYIAKLMSRYGIPDRDAKVILAYVKNCVNHILVQNVIENGTLVAKQHIELGWASYNGETVFKFDKIYSVNCKINSRYTGIYNIESKGSLQNFSDMIARISYNEPLIAVACMAAAATILPFANQNWGVRMDNAINHLVGDTTSGKTSAAYIFGAFCGAPEGYGKVIWSFLSTANAIMKKVEGVQGYPIAIDEFSSGLSKSDWNSFVYSLANGECKERCIGGGYAVQMAKTFSTVFLTTGEVSILSKCTKNGGIRARLFEFDVDSWTYDADESDYIKSVCQRNFGFATPLIAEELLRNGEKWHNVFVKWKGKIRDRIDREKLIFNIRDRVSNMVALYMTACEILCEVLNVCLNTMALYDFFFYNMIFKNAEDSNLSIRVYDAIVRHFVKSKELYVDECYASVALSNSKAEYNRIPEMEGIICDVSRVHKDVHGNEYNQFIIFYPDILEEIIKNYNFSDFDVAMKALYKDKLLKTHDSNRAYFYISLEGIKTRVYGVYIDDKSYDNN